MVNMFIVFILLYFVNIYVIMCVCIIVIINININFIFIKYYYIINPPRDILDLSRAFWRKKKIIKRLLWSGWATINM